MDSAWMICSSRAMTTTMTTTTRTRERVAAVNARGDVVRAVSSTKAMSMSSSMAETSEEAVRVLVAPRVQASRGRDGLGGVVEHARGRRRAR